MARESTVNNESISKTEKSKMLGNITSWCIHKKLAYIYV
jgi:hypothetical protein